MKLFISTIGLIQDWDFQLIPFPPSFSDNEKRFRKLGYILQHTIAHYRQNRKFLNYYCLHELYKKLKFYKIIWNPLTNKCNFINLKNTQKFTLKYT